MDFISLFSGIGGFDLAFERVGMSCVAQVEIDSAARGVLADRLPNKKVFTDVKKTNKTNLPAASIVCAGSPCQDFSMAGGRQGLDGAKSGLFFEFIRVIQDLNPTWIVFENVDGLLISNSGRDFATVLFYLGQCGYRCAWRVFDAQYFGIPQRRRRVFVVGHRGNERRAAQVLFDTQSDSGNVETSSKAETTVSSRSGSAVDGSGSSFERDGRIMISDARGKGLGQICPTLTTGLDRITDYTPVLFEENGVRRLTPLECERLQGFPDEWTATSYGKLQTDGYRYKQLGNAAPVPVLEWIGKRIVREHVVIRRI